MLSESQIQSNIAAASAFENEILQENVINQSNENAISNDIDTEDDVIMEPPPSPNPSSCNNSSTYQMPEPTEHPSNIISICNPNIEDSNVRQYSASEFFDKRLSMVQKPSWVKDATCE